MISDPISDSLQKFGNQIGGEVFLPKHQNGKHFDDGYFPIGLSFYSTTVASSYNYLDKDEPKRDTNECPLGLYIDRVVNTLDGDKRLQPTCECDPENHLHIFRLPMTYFLIDGLDQQIIEILRTIKNQKIYIHSTNKKRMRMEDEMDEDEIEEDEIYLDEMNLADKLIKLSQRDFEDEDTLRSVWNILTDFANILISAI